MIIESVSYGEKHHVNMGAYEWVEFEASATVHASEAADQKPGILLERAKEIVCNRLHDDLNLARSLTAEDDTYVNHLLDQPRRATSRRVRRRP